MIDSRGNGMRVYHRGLSDAEQRTFDLLKGGNRIDQRQLKYYGIKPQTIRALIRKKMVREVVVGQETFYELK